MAIAVQATYLPIGRPFEAARDDGFGYGVICWKQEVRFHRAFGVEFNNPDLVAYAESFGAAGFRVEGPTELSAVMKAALACGKPAVIDCPVDYSENRRLSERLHRLS